MDFSFWNYYNELNVDEKIFLSSALNSGIESNALKSALKNNTIENCVKLMIGNNSEYKKIKRFATKNPIEFMTTNFSVPELDLIFKDILSRYNLWEERLGEPKPPIETKFIEATCMMFSNDLSVKNNSRDELEKIIIKNYKNSFASYEKTILNLTILSNLPLKNEFTYIINDDENYHFPSIIHFFIFECDNKKLNDEFLSKIKSIHEDEFHDFMKDFALKNSDEISQCLKRLHYSKYAKSTITLINEIALSKKVSELTRVVNKSKLVQAELEKCKEIIELEKNNFKLTQNEMNILQKENSRLIKEVKQQEKNKPEYAVKLIEELYHDIKLKDIEIQKLNKNIHTQNKVPEKKLFETLMKNQEEEIINLRIRNKELKEENKKLSRTIEKPISFFKEYIEESGINEDLLTFLKPYILTSETLLKNNDTTNAEKYINSNNGEQKESIVQEIPLANVLGYIKGEEDGSYYLVAGNNKRIKIEHIPEKTYLAENQFALIKSNGDFLATFPYVYLSGYKDFLVEEFGIYHNSEKPYIRTANNQFYDASELKMNIWDKTIVGLNRDNEVIKFYKQTFFNADSYFRHASLKNHKLYFVDEILTDLSILATDVETGNSLKLKSISLGDISLDEKTTISVKDNEIITAFYNVKFYTSSSFYKGKISGIVTEIDGEIYLNSLCGSCIKISKFPPNVIKEADFCTIDEYGNFLKKEPTAKFVELEKSKFTPKKSPRKEPSVKEDVPTKANVLVIGNIHYQKSYNETLRKNGFNATVVSGFESFNTILNNAKNNDIVVLNASHISHDNMWKLKDSDINILYSTSDGANRIVEEIETYLASK